MRTVQMAQLRVIGPRLRLGLTGCRTEIVSLILSHTLDRLLVQPMDRMLPPGPRYTGSIFQVQACFLETR